MYRINENIITEKYIMLIPAMLDDHFPLLKYAFYSPDYHPVILENRENIKDTGLRYVNNDMCYPAILNIGQMISALESGEYDLSKTVLMMPQAGDMCRGSNYISILRKAVAKAGFSVPVLSLNAKGLEKDSQVVLRPYMIIRALAAAIYGDVLMLLCNQTRPYEKEKGSAEALRSKWISRLSEDFRSGKNLSVKRVLKNSEKIADDFRKLPVTGDKKKKVGITGELYIRYCSLGNSELIRCLEKENCECSVTGLLWYILYYIDTHLAQEGIIMKNGYKTFYAYILQIQKRVISVLKNNGFSTAGSYDEYRANALEYIEPVCCVGDGWLMAADIVSFSGNGFKYAIGAQPFGCMVNQVCGRSMYTSLARKLGNISIASVDFDPGASQLNIINRIKMILENF